MKSAFAALLFAPIAILTATRAGAQVTLSLTTAQASGVPGDTLTFSGAVANNGLTTVSLDGIEIDGNAADGQAYVTDSDLFFEDTPATLDGGQEYAGYLFQVILSDDAVPGVYEGQVEVFTGDGTGNETASNSQNFIVNVDAPAAGNMFEPPVWMFALAGVIVGIAVGLIEPRRKSYSAQVTGEAREGSSK